MIIFSTRSFADDHKGPGIKPIRVIKAVEGEVILDIPKCGYDCRLGEGLYQGILGMYGINTGKVEQHKCVLKGDPSCEFHITR